MSQHRVFGLIGYPLGHSFSRKFHSERFEREGIDAEYRNFEIPSIDRLDEVLATPGLAGLNVTIPYKQQVMARLTGLDPVAEAIGAVNVIKVERDSMGNVTALKGYNSDTVGFRLSIAPLLQSHHRHALVLGTGGAAKAVWHGLKGLGLEPVYVSRRPAPGCLTYSDLLQPGAMEKYTVIVNATPLGMYPKVDTCPDIPYSQLTPAHLLYDVVYNPEVTEFMQRGLDAGATVKGGGDMLTGQAIEAWNMWNS